MTKASDGDYVQQMGMAGTGLPPIPLAWRTFLADLRLRRLFYRTLRREFLHSRLSRGVRVADAGVTFLVDYDDPETSLIKHLAGHAVYTRSRWLPFHCELAADELYGTCLSE